MSGPNISNDTSFHEEGLERLEALLGPRFQDPWSVGLLFTVYGLIFISGTVGNICTCIVIVRNSYMQTATNYYLFSLAISDVLILILGKFHSKFSVIVKSTCFSFVTIKMPKTASAARTGSV